jgi:large subunit ribosomal protein L9
VQVVLLQDVKGLGDAGATVDVAPGYARNFLVPRGLAQAATPQNVARARREREQRARQAERALEAARAAAATLDGQEVAVHAHAGESGRLFGSVTAADVAAALAQRFGVDVDRRRVLLAEPIKSLGAHEVTLRLHSDVTARVIVRVEPE